jgi:hypothetical protein
MLMHKVALSALAILGFTAPLLSSTVGASTPNGLTILTKALTDGSHESSMTITGSFVASGFKASVDGGFAAAAEGGVTTVAGTGSEDIVGPVGKNYCFVKASSLAVLKSEFEVKNPTAAEIGVWYKLPSSDPRFAEIDSASGAQTVAESFSFSAIGWKRAATYEGTAVLRGVHVIKLESASNLFVSASGFGKTTLYVTNTSHSLPFAMSGPVGTTGLVYFSKWGTTTVAIPSASSDLPQ